MARSKIPGVLERRHLVERELTPEKALGIAEAYLAEGRTVEATDFVSRAGANAADRLEELREQALASGDVFLLRIVASAADAPLSRAEWGRIAEAAEAAGKDRYATEARRQAERGED